MIIEDNQSTDPISGVVEVKPEIGVKSEDNPRVVVPIIERVTIGSSKNNREDFVRKMIILFYL